MDEIVRLERNQENEIREVLESFGNIRHEDDYIALNRQHKAQKDRQELEQLQEIQEQQLQQLNERMEQEKSSLTSCGKVMPTTTKDQPCQIVEMQRRHRDIKQQLKREQKAARKKSKAFHDQVLC